MALRNHPKIVEVEFFFAELDLRGGSFIEEYRRRLDGPDPRYVAVRFFDRREKFAPIIKEACPHLADNVLVKELLLAELTLHIRDGEVMGLRVNDENFTFMNLSQLRWIAEEAHRTSLMSFSLFASGFLLGEDPYFIARRDYRKLEAEH
jgi:hypothetical protein